MPKIVCPRGHSIRLTEGSVSGTLNYFNEEEWETALDEIVEVLQASPPVPNLTLRDRVRDAISGVLWEGYICPECGALTLPEDERVRWFLNVPVGGDYSDTAGDPP